jgi:hypothetical protein
MLATILKFLIGGIGVYFVGKLLWQIFLKYRANRFNKAALTALDNQIKKLIKKLDPKDSIAAGQIAQLNQKKKNLEKLKKLLEEKLENDN